MAVVAVVTALVAIPGPAEAAIDTDPVRLTDGDMDFGNNIYLFGAPIGSGSVQWDIVKGFYTPRLIGTLHLDGVLGKYGRMHVSPDSPDDLGVPRRPRRICSSEQYLTGIEPAKAWPNGG